MRTHTSETRRVFTKLRLGLGYDVERSPTDVRRHLATYCPRQAPTGMWGRSTPVVAISPSESLQRPAYRKGRNGYPIRCMPAHVCR
jgi:hypothetical protein